MEVSAQLQRAGVWSSNFVLGSLVMALYGVLILWVFFGFASYIIRTDVEARFQNESMTLADGTEVPLTFEQLVFVVETERDLQKTVMDKSGEIQKLDAQLYEAKKLKRDADVRIAHAEAELSHESAEIMNFYFDYRAKMDPEMMLPLAQKLDDPEKTIDFRADLVLAEFSASDPLNSVSEEEVEHMWGALNELKLARLESTKRFTMLEQESLDAVQHHDNLIEQRQTPRLAREAALTTLRNLNVSSPIESSQRAFLDLLDGKLFGVPRALVIYPTIFLTMLVTIGSGALGAVVSFSRRFFANDPVTVSQLFMGVGEGIAAAIAIFLFSGAGMLVLTTSGAGPSDHVELSPYMVAFVAFLSGFMAEDAFKAIQGAGKRLFNPKIEDSEDEPEPQEI